MLKNLLGSIFGTRNDRLISNYKKLVTQINALEDKVKKLKDVDFKNKTEEFKERIKKGESLDSILVEVFAHVREAGVRSLGMRHFDEQLIGGMVLNDNKISEMRTGEGKTLVATLPVYLNALSGKGVHVVTVNDYLARRDAEWMGKLYNFLGLTVGINLSRIAPEEKKKAYESDITYGTNNEFGFDYLRDNMVYAASERVQRPLNFAVVDEVDSILIDEARTPLIISGQAEDNIGVDSVKVFYSNDDGVNYLLMGSFTDPNIDSLKFDIPIGATDKAKVKVVALDHQGNSGYDEGPYFTVIDNTPPTVSISNPTQNEQFEIGIAITVGWDGNDNVGISSVDINYSLDERTTWQEIIKNLTGLESHQWLAPNVITNNLIIQVIVYDAIGFSDTATVDSIGTYPVYPKIVNIDPESDVLRWFHQDISITFSRDMDPTVFTNQNVIVTSEYSSEPELLYNSSDKKLIIRNSSGYVSLDTIRINLNGSGLTSAFGYKMDGDGDGAAGGDSSLQYNSLMLADFDTSNTIDVSDLAIMLTALETKNYYYDIGPVLNTVPHFLAQPDSKFDIEDIMTFAMMWNWFSASNPSSVNDLITLGNPLNIEFDHKGIAIEFPEGAIAGQVQILGLNGRLEYGINKDDKYLGLDYFNEETQFFTYIMERNKDGVIEIPIKIKGKSTDLDMSYKFVDQDGNVISQATQSIKIENIPEQFNLHQNYPNPFNPITTINYDLPQQAYVNLMIYDILGREVVKLVSEEMPAGYKTIIWDSRNNYGESVSAGIYFYQIQTKDFVKTKKMVLLK